MCIRYSDLYGRIGIAEVLVIRAQAGIYAQIVMLETILIDYGNTGIFGRRNPHEFLAPHDTRSTPEEYR
jgi:hypothetical protein